MQLSWSRTSNQADETVGRNRAFASPVTTWPDRRIRDSLGANHCEEHTHAILLSSGRSLPSCQLACGIKTHEQFCEEGPQTPGGSLPLLAPEWTERHRCLHAARFIPVLSGYHGFGAMASSGFFLGRELLRMLAESGVTQRQKQVANLVCRGHSRRCPMLGRPRVDMVGQSSNQLREGCIVFLAYPKEKKLGHGSRRRSRMECHGPGTASLPSVERSSSGARSLHVARKGESAMPKIQCCLRLDKKRRTW